MPQARTTWDVGGRKELLHCLQHCSAALVMQHVAYRFPGWGGLRLKYRVRRDFDRTPGSHCQHPVRLLDGKKGHGIAKKVHIMAIHTRLRQHDEFMAGADLLSAIARSEVDDVMADGDSARVCVRGGVLHLIDHGGLARALAARCRALSAWLK